MVQTGHLSYIAYLSPRIKLSILWNPAAAAGMTGGCCPRQLPPGTGNQDHLGWRSGARRLLGGSAVAAAAAGGDVAWEGLAAAAAGWVVVVGGLAAAAAAAAWLVPTADVNAFWVVPAWEDNPKWILLHKIMSV